MHIHVIIQCTTCTFSAKGVASKTTILHCSLAEVGLACETNCIVAGFPRSLNYGRQNHAKEVRPLTGPMWSW